MNQAAGLALIFLCVVVLGLALSRPCFVYSQTCVNTSADLVLQRNLTGVGQSLMVNVSISPSPPSSALGLQNITLTITSPDGTYQRLGPFLTYQNYTLVTECTPTQVGTYTIVANFPGEAFDNNSTYYLPCSAQTILTVQEAPVPIPTPTPTSMPTLSPTSTSSTTPQPTPQSSSMIQATTGNGSTVNLAISGNITSSQMSDITLQTNQSSELTTISFSLTGQTGTTGLGNITIPQSDVLSGSKPIIYIDNQIAQNQGYTQDSNNYYVWYTTHFSTHEISIVFSATPKSTPLQSINPGGPNHSVSTSNSLDLVYGLATGVVIVVIVLVLLNFVINARSNKFSGKNK